MSSEARFEIMEHIGSITAETDRPVKKELNIVSWNERKPAYDLRSWKYDESGGRVAAFKGIVLSGDELKALRDLLNKIEF